MGVMLLYLAEGEGFEPSTPVTQGKHLAGARTRPLCDPSLFHKANYILFYYAYFYNIATLMMRPFSNLSLFSHAKESIREAKPLLYKFPQINGVR